MAVLRRLAARGLECPSNAKLAEMAGLKDAESARYRLGLLAQAGPNRGQDAARGPRIVTIVATGLSTGGPGNERFRGAFDRHRLRLARLRRSSKGRLAPLLQPKA
jgi:hypothetical protein